MHTIGHNDLDQNEREGAIVISFALQVLQNVLEPT